MSINRAKPYRESMSDRTSVASGQGVKLKFNKNNDVERNLNHISPA